MLTVTRKVKMFQLKSINLQEGGWPDLAVWHMIFLQIISNVPHNGKNYKYRNNGGWNEVGMLPQLYRKNLGCPIYLAAVIDRTSRQRSSVNETVCFKEYTHVATIWPRNVWTTHQLMNKYTYQNKHKSTEHNRILN